MAPPQMRKVTFPAGDVVCLLQGCHYAVVEAAVSLAVYSCGHLPILDYQHRGPATGGQLSVANV